GGYAEQAEEAFHDDDAEGHAHEAIGVDEGKKQIAVLGKPLDEGKALVDVVEAEEEYAASDDGGGDGEHLAEAGVAQDAAVEAEGPEHDEADGDEDADDEEILSQAHGIEHAIVTQGKGGKQGEGYNERIGCGESYSTPFYEF